MVTRALARMHAEHLVTLTVEGIVIEHDRPDVAVALLLQACTEHHVHEVHGQSGSTLISKASCLIGIVFDDMGKQQQHAVAEVVHVGKVVHNGCQLKPELHSSNRSSAFF